MAYAPINNPEFTGIVKANALSLGETTSQSSNIYIDTEQIKNGDFSTPTIPNNQTINVFENIQYFSNFIWNISSLNSLSDQLTLNRNDTLQIPHKQFIGVSSSNKIFQNLNEDINIGTYKVEFYAKKSDILSNINIVFNIETSPFGPLIPIYTENINISTNEWNLYTFNFNNTEIINDPVISFMASSTNFFDITGIKLSKLQNKSTNLTLDVNGSIFISDGVILEKQTSSSVMSIVSSNLNVTSNTNIKSGLTLGYLNNIGILHSSSNGVITSSKIVNDDISNFTQINDTKLATISSSGKVSNSATSANIEALPETIVLRDIEGFSYSNTPLLESSNNIVATTGFVKNVISNLIDNAPEMMNTLGELANAINENGGANIMNILQNVDTSLNLKADKAAVDTSLNLKADISALDLKADISALDLKADISALDLKADISALDLKADISALDLKADKAAVDTSLNLKANISALDLKADKAAVDTSLNLKANISALDLKADKAAVDTSLNLKASKLYVDELFSRVDLSALDTKADKSDLNLKADKTAVDTSLNLKANKTAVDTSLNLKADKTTVETSLTFKANKTYVDGSLNLRATKIMLADVSLSIDLLSTNIINQSLMRFVQNIPASSTSIGVKGDVAISQDNLYLYICVDNNRWIKLNIGSTSW